MSMTNDHPKGIPYKQTPNYSNYSITEPTPGITEPYCNLEILARNFCSDLILNSKSNVKGVIRDL